MPAHVPFPALPAPPSWFPGHMRHFARTLPALLARTDVVLELRDARLPLTSINPNLEGALQKWRQERGRGHPHVPAAGSPGAPPPPAPPPHNGRVCERIVVFSKRDLVPEWGIEPFRSAMASRYPDQKVFFASWNRPSDIKLLNELLVDIGKRNPHIPELNVLVVGMPNVGKSTLLNALRNIGIPGPTPKALRTSAQPGLTRVLSTRLKLSADPRVYAFDAPGVMLPFLGRGDAGAERGVKLALIGPCPPSSSARAPPLTVCPPPPPVAPGTHAAGIKEGLYDPEALAAYLLYRLNVLDPAAPAYLRVLPPGTPPLADAPALLDALAARLRMLKKGGAPDHARAAAWLVKWWREEGARAQAAAASPAASSPPSALPTEPSALPTEPSALPAEPCRRGWGFDFEWAAERTGCGPARVQREMEACIDAFERAAREEARVGGGVSPTQERKRVRAELLARRAARGSARLAARRGGG
ncbi:hypothetical protein AcV7_002612 [Taiwanofungus camphoratus]|nr:hypothetical protein AcV7_002612 [Antrodia cinnamomea]